MKVLRVIEPHLYDKLMNLMKQNSEKISEEKPEPKVKEPSVKTECPKHFQSFEDFVKQRKK